VYRTHGRRGRGMTTPRPVDKILSVGDARRAKENEKLHSWEGEDAGATMAKHIRSRPKFAKQQDRKDAGATYESISGTAGTHRRRRDVDPDNHNSPSALSGWPKTAPRTKERERERQDPTGSPRSFRWREEGGSASVCVNCHCFAHIFPSSFFLLLPPPPPRFPSDGECPRALRPASTTTTTTTAAARASLLVSRATTTTPRRAAP
jgi:hypothetical protein